MKRFIYAAGAVVLTGVLVLLAMAVAQRDSRIGESATNESELPYANQSAEPISIATDQRIANEVPYDESWPPSPIVRGNDSGSIPRLPASLAEKYPNEEASSEQISLTSFANGPPKNTDEPPLLRGNNSFPAPLSGSGWLPSNSNELSNAPSAGNANLLPPLPKLANELVESPQADESNSGSLSAPPLANLLPVNPTLDRVPNNGLRTDREPAMTNRAAADSISPNPVNPNPSFANEGTDRNSAPIATLGPPVIPNGPSPNAFPSSLPQLPRGNPGLDSPSLASPELTSPTMPSQSLPPQSLPPQSFSPQATLPSVPSLSPQNNAAASRSFGSSEPLASTNGPSMASPTTPQQKWYSSAAPGGRQLDGSQNPSMEIQKRAPSEVQVGQPATFTILVRNVGNATAFDVNVVDSVPKGAKLIRTSPQAQQTGVGGGLVWKLGEMPAGSEQVLTLELTPETEGEIGSVASVNFAAQASVRTMSTQPKLVVKQVLESLVLGGESIRIMIEIANVGTGTARDVRLQEDVPDTMRHSTGFKVLELSLGDLAPGESEKRDIELTGVTAGKVKNVIRAVSENAATSESQAELEVVSPKLDIAIEGASLRYLERQVTYSLNVRNSGTAIASNVEILMYLPSGMQFNSTINQGAYLASQHAVRWELAELAAGANAVTEVTLLPVEEGNFVIRMQAQADSVRAESIQKPVRVEGQSELSFTIEDDNDPIETDGKTTYLVKLTNIGTRVDKNIEVMIDLPEGAVVEQVDAPVDYKVSQRNVIFAPISQMQAKDRQNIRLSVRHTREGTHVVRAQVKSQLRPVPVGKEESTQVYLDR